MVDPISSFLIANVARYVAGYAQGRAKVDAERSVRRDDRRFQDEMQQKRFEHERALEVAKEEAGLRTVKANVDADYIQLLNRLILDRYPVADGPGTLRSSLALTDSGDGRQAPLLVLLSPLASDDAPIPSWTGLRQRVQDDLMVYQRKELIRTRLIDRPFQWPHAQFYNDDLRGIPTLIIQVTIARQRLGIHLGGCHLGGDAVCDTQSMYSLRWPAKESWTDDAVAQLNTSAVAGSAFPLAVPETDDDLAELNHELASRVITLCAATALDAYYLVHREGYDEQIDNAIVAAGLVADDWPVDTGVSPDVIRDSAYHLLHCADRRLTRRDRVGAEADLFEAFGSLTSNGASDSSVDALVEHALAGTRIAYHHCAKAQAVTARLPARHPWRRACADLCARQIGRGVEEAAMQSVPTATPALAPGARVMSRAAHSTGQDDRPGTQPRELPGGGSWSRRANKDPLAGDDS